MPDETSLVNLDVFAESLPPTLAKAFKSLSPTLAEKPPEELVPDPDIRLVGIRQNLWREVKTAQQDPTYKVILKNILGSFMSPAAFYTRLESDESFVAWLANPPLDERAFLDAALEIGQMKLLEILKLPITKLQTDKHGTPIADEEGEWIRRVDIQAAKLIHSTFITLDKRKHGEYTQKILQKGQVEHTHEKIEEREVKEVPSLADINARIAELEGDGAKQLTDETST